MQNINVQDYPPDSKSSAPEIPFKVLLNIVEGIFEGVFCNICEIILSYLLWCLLLLDSEHEQQVD